MNSTGIFYIEGQNCDINGIKVTIKSLREHFKDDIIVLYNNVNLQLICFLESQNVKCVNCNKFKVLFKTSPYNNKIIYTYLYLKNNTTFSENDLIMFCDIGDVYFRADPFTLYKGKITVFSEDLLFKDCETNKTWSNVCYNSDITNQLQDKVVINSGIILANFKDLLNCFKLMLNEMSCILGKVNYPITDQTILNKILYIDRSINCFIDSQNANNMAQGIKTDINNKINHQYKVIPKIKLELYKQYS